eukprot:Rmarinus@m.14465
MADLSRIAFTAHSTETSGPESKQVPLVCPGHSRPIYDLKFSDETPDGVFMVSGCLDGKAMLRRADTGDWVGTFEGHKGAVWGISINNEATKVATSSADFTAKVWDALSGDELLSFDHKHIVKSVDFSMDTTRMATAGAEKLVRVFDLAKPDSDPHLFQGHTDSVKRVSFLRRHPHLVVSGAADKTLRVWDTRSGTAVHLLETPAAVLDFEEHRGDPVLTVTTQREIQFWNLDSFTLDKSVPLNVDVESVTLHPNKSRLVTGCSDLLVRALTYPEAEVIECYRGHHGPVHIVRLHPNAETFASGSEDGTIRVWQTSPPKPDVNEEKSEKK